MERNPLGVARFLVAASRALQALPDDVRERLNVAADFLSGIVGASELKAARIATWQRYDSFADRESAEASAVRAAVIAMYDENSEPLDSVSLFLGFAERAGASVPQEFERLKSHL